MLSIVTNFDRFPARWTAATGECGTSAKATTVDEFLSQSQSPETVLVVNCDPVSTEQLAARFLFSPARRRPLVAVDMVLRRPRTLLARMRLPWRRFLLRRVDHHIHYFLDLKGFEEVYGIGPQCSSYVPFKSNLFGRNSPQAVPEGDYILCFGRSLRDYDTFFAAMEKLPYPAAIAKPDLAQMHAHGARFSRKLDQLPPNVKILPDDGSTDAQIDILSGARLVVLPILSSSIVASGISTCLNAMLLGKCVIGSEGPGMSDVFPHGEILTVAPENPKALAAVIRQAWEDDTLRKKTAAAGQQFAIRQGGEPELYQRIIDRIAQWLRSGAARTSWNG